MDKKKKITLLKEWVKKHKKVLLFSLVGILVLSALYSAIKKTPWVIWIRDNPELAIAGGVFLFAFIATFIYWKWVGGKTQTWRNVTSVLFIIVIAIIAISKMKVDSSGYEKAKYEARYKKEISLLQQKYDDLQSSTNNVKTVDTPAVVRTVQPMVGSDSITMQSKNELTWQEQNVRVVVRIK